MRLACLLSTATATISATTTRAVEFNAAWSSMQLVRHAVVPVDERALEVADIDQRRLQHVSGEPATAGCVIRTVG